MSSYRTCGCVVSHTWMSHVIPVSQLVCSHAARVNASCRHIARVDVSCLTHEWVMSYLCRSSFLLSSWGWIISFVVTSRTWMLHTWETHETHERHMRHMRDTWDTRETHETHERHMRHMRDTTHETRHTWDTTHLKLYVSFTQEPYERDDILQQRRIILRRHIHRYDMPTCHHVGLVGSLELYVSFAKYRLFHRALV